MFEANRNGRQHDGITEVKQKLNAHASSLAHILKCTNLNQQDERVEHYERQFRNMCDGHDEVFWFSLFRPTPLLRVSPSFKRIWGHEVEKLYQNPKLWVNAILSEDRLRVEQTFDAWLKQRPRIGYEVQFRIARPDQSILLLRDNVSGLFDEYGALFGTSGVVCPITDCACEGRHL